jgi:hypothetical protein
MALACRIAGWGKEKPFERYLPKGFFDRAFI